LEARDERHQHICICRFARQQEYKDVMKVQVMLNHFIGSNLLSGYKPLGLDGHCGPKTKEAISAFQFQNGLISEEHFQG